MIVEDEFLMRQGLKHMISWEEEGYQVVAVASNGEEALELVEKHQPHIVVTDIKMPQMDGLQLLQILKKQYPELQVLVLSSYDDFDYVKTALMEGAVDYILKPTLNPTNFLNSLQMAVQKIPEFHLLEEKEEMKAESVIERYLLGFTPHLEEGFLHKFFPDNTTVLFGTYLFQENLPKKKSQIIKQINIFQSTEKFPYKFFIVSLNQETLFLMINCQEAEIKLLKESLQKLYESIHSILESEVFVLSPRIYNMENFKDFFWNQYEPALRNRFYQKGHFFVDLNKNHEIKKKVDSIDFLEWNLLLQKKEFMMAFTQIEKYITMAIAAKLEENELKNAVKNLLYTLISEIDVDSELDSFRVEAILDLERASFVEEFVDVFDQISQKLKEFILTQKQGNQRMEEILEYIETHYMEELDLKEVAKTFAFNYSYLSSYFSNEIGEGFSEYLNRLRVHKACELLETSNEPVSIIGEKVGYINSSYFSRVFKKSTGFTPREYKLYKKGKIDEKN